MLAGVPLIPKFASQGANKVLRTSESGHHAMKTLSAVVLAAGLIALPAVASAQERVGDAALGALAGAVVAGPVGAVAGGAIGYTAGPRIAHRMGVRHRHAHRHVRQRQAQR
jgi:hypothetical protein